MFSWTRRMIVLGLGLLVASPAVAVEHTYPGAMCVEVSGKPEVNGKSPLIDAEGQLFNVSPSYPLVVLCPVVGPFDDLSEGSANVFVTDRHKTQDICCEARANNVGAFAHSSTVCSQDTDTRLQTLVLTPPTVGFSFTSRYFVCTIPPADHGEASGILLYRY